MADYKQAPPPPAYEDPARVGYDQPQGSFGLQPVGQAATSAQTTVIINQPMPATSGQAPRLWSSGLCDMCDDCGICLCVAFCGFCHDCSLAADMGESACVPCCVPAYPIALRVKWRAQENIHGSIMDDCVTVMCCGPCATCQLAREVKAKRNGVVFRNN